MVKSNKGKPNAAVFPVPVWAEAIKSWLEDIKCGITFHWIGVGRSKPSSLIAFISSLFKEKFKQTKYFNLINDINTFAPVKFISKIKKDDNVVDADFEEVKDDKEKSA